MKVNLGCALFGFANPHPDNQDPLTAMWGVMKRFIRKPPDPDRQLRRKFRKFVKVWCKTNIAPLPPDVDVSFESWIEHVPYPLWKKEKLRRTYERIICRKDPKYFKVNSFVKDEPYPEYKHARAINSRSDEFKTLIGPWFKPIEKALFSLPWFIKKVPVDERPEYIMNLVGRNNVVYYATDYSAYETHFDRRMMKDCEFILYKHMVSNVPGRSEFLFYLDKVLAGENVCEFKNFVVKCNATRMSGEMNTSLGNGFSNLMFMLFMCEQNQCEDVVGVVEGDDGLFSMRGKPPSVEDFAKLGLIVKAEVHQYLETASFCGLIFDTIDLRNVTDPIDVLMDFGWASGRYSAAGRRTQLELIKAKSLSLMYQYPGCPIISSLARYGLRCTRGIRVGKVLSTMNQWYREQLLEALRHRAKITVPVGDRTRQLVQDKWGILVRDQIDIERYLDGLEQVETLIIPEVQFYSHKDASHYWDNYQSSGSVIDAPLLPLPRSKWNIPKIADFV